MAIVRADSIRLLAFGGITGSYATVGSAIAHNWRTFKVTNNTNADLFISFDGTTDNIVTPKTSFTLYDLATNAPPIPESDNFVLQVGTQFYARAVSGNPSSGSVYVEGLYAKGE